MADMLTRNGILALKIQADESTAATPTVGSDAIEVEAPVVGPNSQTVTTNEVTGSLDIRPPVISRANGAASFTALFKGSGAAATAPDVGAALRCCGMTETVTASAVTGTGQNGGSTTVARLASGASSTDDAYVGMRYTVTSGTNNGYVGRIVSYNGTTKDATLVPAAGSTFDSTSVYSIAANVRYRPTSTITEWASIWHWKRATGSGNAVVDKVASALGSWELTTPVGDVGRLAFTFAGRAVASADVSDPGAATYDATRPVAYQGATTYLGGAVVRPTTWSVSFGATPVATDDPNDPYGYGNAVLTGRSTTGSIQIPQTLIANRDFFALARNQTQMSFAVSWGPSAGYRTTLVIPALIVNSRSDTDNQGVRQETIQFGAFGNDRGAFLVFD